MQCNMVDLLANANKVKVPTSIPTMSPIGKDDPSNTKFVSTRDVIGVMSDSVSLFYFLNLTIPIYFVLMFCFHPNY